MGGHPYLFRCIVRHLGGNNAQATVRFGRTACALESQRLIYTRRSRVSLKEKGIGMFKPPKVRTWVHSLPPFASSSKWRRTGCPILRGCRPSGLLSSAMPTIPQTSLRRCSVNPWRLLAGQRPQVFADASKKVMKASTTKIFKMCGSMTNFG